MFYCDVKYSGILWGSSDFVVICWIIMFLSKLNENLETSLFSLCISYNIDHDALCRCTKVRMILTGFGYSSLSLWARIDKHNKLKQSID